MASSSSSLTPRNYSYNVFASFHGPDVRKTRLSHLREQFNRNGISMFVDPEIARSEGISPSLKKAIQESRISIVVLSKKYASSRWCLDELVEILECKKAMGQIVMTIFYGVDPSHVRKQIGEFGMAFDETCAGKTDEERQKWSKALNEVSNIAGEELFRWHSEADMIKKIVIDVVDKLNATPSIDLDGMVGIEAHLKEMEALLDLDNGGVKMVGITGPAGIGKTTIARALQYQLSDRFQVSCFVDNLRGSYHSGFDEFGLKLHLQEQFLSKVQNQSGMRIRHLGAIKENLSDQRVLIILDDVNHINQLMALANENTWFGPGSRIVVTTEYKELLQQHGINNTYHVRFPSRVEALKILCRYAFRQNSPYHGFEKLLKSVAALCGNLPLGLRVVGSSLRGKKEDEWKDVVRRLETNIDRDIEDVLKVGYESLDENEKRLFLLIVVSLQYKKRDLVKTMLADRDLDVERGLIILESRSLIEIFGAGRIVMHKLLQQVGRKVLQDAEAAKWTLISSNKLKSKPRCFTVIAFVFFVINLLIEIASAVADQLSSIRKPYYATISLVMSILSVVLSILDLTYKIKTHEARFIRQWPIPWFYYPERGYRRIFGSFTDTVLLFCVFGGLIVSAVNYSISKIKKTAQSKYRFGLSSLLLAW